MGFRGEALASIAAVSDIELLSKTQDAENGVYVHMKGGEVLETGMRGAAKGSVITVRDLFYNTPARYKFLKKDSTEASYIADILQKLAIAIRIFLSACCRTGRRSSVRRATAI